MAKDLKLVLLLDCYGTLLTDRQRQMIQLYYDEDLSLGEIAQIIGISRQAVRDSVKRSEQILYDMEAHLHVAARMTALREQSSIVPMRRKGVSFILVSFRYSVRRTELWFVLIELYSIKSSITYLILKIKVKM